MWQPTQYYHTKMQLAQTELEAKLLLVKNKNKKRKTGSGPIMERMRMLELTDAPDEEYTDDWYEAEDSAEQQVQGEEMILEAQSEGQNQEEELQEEVSSEKKKKKKKSGKKHVEEQTPETDTDLKEAEESEHTETQVQMDTMVQTFSAELLQDRMVWAEILGEPVSVRRRKKRVEQLYGNQGHAYRR